MATTPENKKRLREDDDGALLEHLEHIGKKHRPTTEIPDDQNPWGHYDSVLSTPISQMRDPARYDSDDEHSSLVSEPGSPPDVSMGSDDEAGDEFPESFEDGFVKRHWTLSSRTQRVATPMLPANSPGRSRDLLDSIKQHIRQRHPQANHSGDFLEIPPFIDERDAPTPPSAAEAAGSQLSMLSVRDVDMDASESLPTFSVELAHTAIDNEEQNRRHPIRDSAIELEAMDSAPDHLFVRKQRQRSGALSSGASNHTSLRPDASAISGPKRGFSMGFRADCEKCRMRVPGHMNHFIS